MRYGLFVLFLQKERITMIKSNFREWTLEKVEETFGLKEVRHLDILDQLTAYEYSLNAYEQQYLSELR
jgi:hypothetical protein